MRLMFDQKMGNGDVGKFEGTAEPSQIPQERKSKGRQFLDRNWKREIRKEEHPGFLRKSDWQSPVGESKR